MKRPKQCNGIDGLVMTPEEVKAIVDEEIRSGWDADDRRSNPHGVELSRCLLGLPERRTYRDSFNNNEPIEMWMVLKEDPDGQQGYEVFFDERSGEFGLAVTADKGAVLIEYYDSFCETLAAM